MGTARTGTDQPELVEGSVGGGPRPVTVAVEPLVRMRSPIMESRSFDPLPAGVASPAFLLPPLRELTAPSAVALLIAAPLFVLVGWQLALIAGLVAAGVRELERRMPASYSLAAGFLPYRADDGWPRGVREDDDVRWNWSALDPAPNQR